MIVLIAVDCGPLSNPVNGVVDTSEGTTFGSTATYTCNLNFVLNGSSVRTCTAEGVWGGETPTCTGKTQCKNTPDTPQAHIMGRLRS